MSSPFSLDVDGEIRALISHMAPSQKRRIKEAFRSIASSPSEGKPLQDALAGLYSYRSGRLRIIYALDGKRKKVHVVAVGPRRTIYEELEKLLAVRRRSAP